MEDLSQGEKLSEIKPPLLGGAFVKLTATYNLDLLIFKIIKLFFHLFQLGGIATDNDYGSVVMNVEANDPDLDSKLEYSVIGNILPSDKSENLENIEAPPFLLDKNSGDILLNFDPQKGMKGYFAFHVSVRDGFGHVDKATVQIYLLREDQRVRFVFRNQPAEIRARIGRFREVLGKGQLISE